MGAGVSELGVRLTLAGLQLSEKNALVRGRARSAPNERRSVEFG